MTAHCAQCDEYEKTVRALREAGKDAPEGLVPCPDYTMSPAFRQWVLAAMRRDVMTQVSEAGLDRMAMVKAGRSAPGSSQKENGEEE